MCAIELSPEMVKSVRQHLLSQLTTNNKCYFEFFTVAKSLVVFAVPTFVSANDFSSSRNTYSECMKLLRACYASIHSLDRIPSGRPIAWAVCVCVLCVRIVYAASISSVNFDGCSLSIACHLFYRRLSTVCCHFGHDAVSRRLHLNIAFAMKCIIVLRHRSLDARRTHTN